MTITKKRIRKIKSTTSRLRLCVSRSNLHIYAQIIDDSKGQTLASASSLKLDKGNKTDIAKQVGTSIAKVAKDCNITNVVFDRGSYKFHGRVKALADAAREGGLNF
jgi:large subunit ribosomal protein L18